MKKIVTFAKNSYNELVYKVSWPTRAELTNSAIIVMIASVIMSLIVWGVDSFFARIVTFFYGL